MAGAAITSVDDLVRQFNTPGAIKLDLSGMPRGIDNYHVDVALSPNLEFRLRELIENQVKRIMAGGRLLGANAEDVAVVRDLYTDVMEVTLHRSKSDLAVRDIQVLQFAIIKFVLQEVRRELDEQAVQLEDTLAQQQGSGSKNVLATQARVSWFRRYRDEFEFSVNRSVLRALQREEAQLRGLRKQVLGEALSESVNIMFNPMLYARTPLDALLHLEVYAMWPGKGREFGEFNERAEALFASAVGVSGASLKSPASVAPDAMEPYDELGGLFAVQGVLGPSVNQEDVVEEAFSPLDDPANLQNLFDARVHDRHFESAREGLGMKAQWDLKSAFKRFEKLRGEFAKLLDRDARKQLLCTYLVRDKVEDHELVLIKAEDAIAAVAGENTAKVLAAIDIEREGGASLRDKLEALAQDAERLVKDSHDELFTRAMVDYARFRLHLKYFRFAQRIFNRLHLIVDEESLELARSGGRLFHFWDSEEIKEVATDEDNIIRHTIVKADVRGSTSIIRELMKQELNPASYFKLRFFGPISEKLEPYSAHKVFVEGDAIILATYELEAEPAQWFSVSRACGIAKEILDIVISKNAHAAKTGLPALEIGVGICFAEERPLFLVDDERPIMISPAIGGSDRLSSCSWQLREVRPETEFNVELYEVPRNDDEMGEKGQSFLHYNVNGILLDAAAFRKLETEIALTRLNVKVAEETEVMHVGRYPDITGKQRSLVIREGEAGIWRNGGIDEGGVSASNFYEVLPNNRLAMQVIKLAEKHQKKE